MDKKGRFSEAFNYLKDKGIVHTQKDVAKKMGSTSPNVSSAMKGVESVLTDNFLHRFNEAFGTVFDEQWLLTGEGSMLKTEALPAKNGEGVPFYDQDFACGFLDFPDVAERPTEYVNLPGTRGATCWCRATGDSMQPLINNGDYVCLMKIYDPTFLVFGDTYAFDCENGMRTIKKLGRGTQPDTYRLIPVNKAIDEQDIPVSIIRSIFRVVAVAKYL